MTTWHPIAGSAWKAMVGRQPVVVFPVRLRGVEGPLSWTWSTGRCFGDGRKGYAPTLEAAQTMAEAAARGEND